MWNDSVSVLLLGAQTPGAPVWISDMKKGGAAYRLAISIVIL